MGRAPCRMPLYCSRSVGGLPVLPLLICHRTGEGERTQRPDLNLLSLFKGASPREHPIGRKVEPCPSRVTCLGVAIKGNPPQRLELRRKAQIANAAGVEGVPSGHDVFSGVKGEPLRVPHNCTRSGADL